ncbi:MAG: glucose-6-phosphate isomerase, partial [Gammaproteobacteria bacterium]|nr:glucose-6-phosphate isomerase [Gammaproteobacteria bacterium]
MTPTNTKAWKKLATLAIPLQALSEGNTKFQDKSLRSLLEDSYRTKKLQFQLAGMRFDFAKQWIDSDITKELLSLAEETQVLNKAAAMFAGEHINVSENRAVLHSALRHGVDPANPNIQSQVSEVQQRMYSFAQQIHSGTWRGYTGKPITDIVHIGIGGSHLGPELVVNALADHSYSHLRIHFVANIDANDLFEVLYDLSPETTLFIIASKSFSTLETQVNADSARKWFLERTACMQGIANHFIAVTTNIEAAAKF